MNIASLHRDYAASTTTPVEVVKQIFAHVEAEESSLAWSPSRYSAWPAM